MAGSAASLPAGTTTAKWRHSMIRSKGSSLQCGDAVMHDVATAQRAAGRRSQSVGAVHPGQRPSILFEHDRDRAGGERLCKAVGEEGVASGAQHEVSAAQLGVVPPRRRLRDEVDTDLIRGTEGGG